ncbi:enkurin [Scaptodrosophila lebanonensis]|uniref:Enkurin n=1 Tax=Drosophila lebanonensis TaxID=7225 RepID=A0A6J2T4Y5_DROLE|nr:enkurin [Scaptodrosophila lebanonensis]
MSLVFITHHDENIFDVESEMDEAARIGHGRKKYSSKQLLEGNKIAQELRDRLNAEFRKTEMVIQDDGLRLLCSARKADHRTMGCAKTHIDPPCAFLRKNQGVKWRRENEHVCPKGIRDMPPLPRRQPTPGRPTRYPNFVKRNIRCAGKTVPCPPPPRYVDTPIGTRHNVLNSGLVPQFICRKDFGKVPIYLQKTKKMLTETREKCVKEEERMRTLCRIREYRTAKTTDIPGMRLMEAPERAEILEGLRQYLNEMTKQYQSMSLLIDTVAKRQRKGKLEADLRQAEQDILLMETSPVIYVSQF